MSDPVLDFLDQQNDPDIAEILDHDGDNKGFLWYQVKYRNGKVEMVRSGDFTAERVVNKYWEKVSNNYNRESKQKHTPEETERVKPPVAVKILGVERKPSTGIQCRVSFSNSTDVQLIPVDEVKKRYPAEYAAFFESAQFH